MRITHNNESWKIAEVNPIACQIKMTTDDGRQMTVHACKFEKVDNYWKIKSN
jgi:hypothetical protein